MKLTLLILTILLCSCSKPETESKKLKLACTNFPVKWMVDYISGQTLENLYLIPAGIDPAYWEPKDSELQELNTCDMVFYNGATYEKWMETISLSKTFDTSSKIKESFILISNVMEHEHNGKKHSHDGIDFNIWLNSDLFIKQAEAVELKLSSLVENPEIDFKANLKSLVAEIKDIKQSLTECTQGQKSFLASHPVYNYLANQLDWKVTNFHWEPDTMPSEEEWLKLKEAKKHSSFMLWEDMPNDEIRKKLIALNIEVIVFRTCGNTPPSGDFIKEMKTNLENLKTALAK